MEFLTGIGGIVSAILSQDSWEMSQAFRSSAMWTVGLIITFLGAILVLGIYKLVPFIDRHFERTVMVWTYLITAAIIFVEVFRRFVLSEQAPWSTTLPPFLFLIMTWFGCSYNVRLRSHLSFSEFRSNMAPAGQMACLWLDAILWFGFAWLVVTTGLRVTTNSAANFQILLGTDNVLQWWFLITVPLAFILLAARVLENLLEDLRNYKNGEPLIKQAVIGGD